MRKPFVRPMPRTWYWQGPYRAFLIRELTSVFIAGYLVFFIVWLFRLRRGPDAYQAILNATRSPLSVILHVLALAAALYHSVTWFNLTPQAMPVRRGEERLPGALVAVAMGYLPWLLVSALIVWVVTR